MRFLITGDSWSQGEWDGYPTDYKITHLGIQQYLLDDGYDVLNVGKGGFNNIESLAVVENAKIDFDHLIFFFTDPLRQANEIDIKTILPKVIIKNHVHLVEEKLLKIKKDKQSKITVIGGCAKFQPNSSYIDYIIPSITELLVEKFTDSEFMTSREWEEHFFKFEKNFNSAQKQQWLEVMSEASKKYQAWKKNKEYFWPDGLHANRHGLKILYHQLRQLWFNE